MPLLVCAHLDTLQLDDLELVASSFPYMDNTQNDMIVLYMVRLSEKIF